VSHEAIDVVRTATEAFSAGDVERALELFDPDIEWHGTVGGLDEGKVFRGREAVAEQFLGYFAEWERHELRIDRLIDAGGDKVVVFVHEVAEGRESGVVVESDTGAVNTVRDGRIVLVRTFMERAGALREAALPPSVAAVVRAFDELPAVSDAWDPELEMSNPPGWVIHTTYRGREGVRRWWDDLDEAFGDFTMVLMDVRVIDDERVLTTQRFVGTFRSTDIPLDAPWASILTVRNGRIVRAQGFMTVGQGMRAAGIDPH
jgi:ketosteroid isomerase-like protein